MRRKGQSTLEYAIILAVIIGVIVLVGRGLFRTTLTDSLNTATNRIATESQGLAQ
jgi:hypothetical protein